MNNIVNIEKLTWCLLLIVMLVVMIYSFTLMGESTQLKGAQKVIPKPKFSLKTWLNGNFQEKFDKASSSHFAFYNTLVKNHNQYDYYYWNRANAKGVVFGKNGYLFEQSYIDGFYNLNFAQQKHQLSAKKSSIEYTHKELSEFDNNLVFILMPSKAFMHEKEIPKDLQGVIPETHIQDEFLEFAKLKNLNVIDFQKYFLKSREDIPYPIFPKHGIHISEYAEIIVLDSLLKYIEQKQKKDIYDYEFSKSEETIIPRGRDQDIAQALNLKTPLENDEILAYRHLKFQKVDKEKSPRVLVIGDSFYWGIYPRIIKHNLFKRHEFWYRNHKIFPSKKNETKISSQFNCIESITGFDFTFILVTTNMINEAGWGYFDSIFNSKRKSSMSNEDLVSIYKIVNRIKADKAHLKLVQDKAIKKNIPLDSMLYLDAKWIYEKM